jgi:hypothetical protein
MARTPANFKQTDMVRAVKAALAAGLDVVRTEISPDGTIRLIHSDCSPVPASPFDEWKQKRHASPT